MMSRYKVTVNQIVPLVHDFEVESDTLDSYHIEELIRDVILDYIGYSIIIEENDDE